MQTLKLSPPLSLLPLPAAVPLEFHLVRDAVALEALADDWRALLRASASDEPMLAPDWLLTWWGVYGGPSGRRLRVGLFYEGERLVGLVPLCSRRAWHRPGIPMRRLELIGCDVDEGDGVCSEYLGVIAARGHETRIAEACAREVLRGSFGPWHELVLSALDGEHPMTDLLLEAFAQRACPGERTVLMDSPYLTLPNSWEAYLRGTLNRDKRHKLQGALKDFETWAEGDWYVERVRCAEDLRKGQALLAELHNHRWEAGDGQPGVFSKPRFVSFHQEYMPRLLEQGGLELLWLVAKGKPVAAQYQIMANGKAYYYQCGRRIDVPHRVRPGIFLLSLAIQEAIGKGLREFDFLGGDAQYKRMMTRTSRPVVQLRFSRGGPREWLRRGAAWAIGQARRLRRRLPAGANLP